MIARPDFQARNDLLGSLPAADFGLLLPTLKEVPLQQGDVLLEPGERIPYIYFPLSGLISLLTVMGGGEVIETAIIGRDGICGAFSAAASGYALSRAIVQVSGSAARIGAAQFLKAQRDSEKLSDVLRRYHQQQLARTQQLVACNALHSGEARFARWLLLTADLIGGSMILLTQDFISQMLGVRRTTITAIARSLQRRGAIRYSRGRIQIVDREKLRKHACECYEAMRQHTPVRNKRG
jgi:CRP-like cAMP-binding protein